MIPTICGVCCCNRNFPSPKKLSYVKKDICVNNYNSYQLSKYELSKAQFALKNISFTSIARNTSKVQPKSFEYTVELEQNIKKPQISIELNSDINIPENKEIKSVYLFALNDQLNEIPISDDINDFNNNLDILTRSISFVCPAKNIIGVLDTLCRDYINVEINPKHIQKAKQLAPIGYFLYVKADEFQKEYSDLPKNIPEKEFEALIDKITNEDIKSLNDNIIKNSNIKMTIKMDENDYSEYKDNIQNFINEAFIK